VVKSSNPVSWPGRLHPELLSRGRLCTISL